jgi:hypothetical protein
MINLYVSNKNKVLKLYRELSLDELKKQCKSLGITNTVIYKERYKEIPNAPAHPERVYLSEWVSYKDLFDIKEFVKYTDLKSIAQKNKIKNGNDYKKFIRKQNDLTLPLDPQSVYVKEWENWYKFLGKEEPFKPEFIPAKYAEWASHINIFMKQARGGESKKTHLCRFVRLFVESHDKSVSPQAMLMKDRIDIKPFRRTIDSFENDSLRRKVIAAVNEFLDYIIDSYLTIEDEDTGEIVRVNDARNPFSLLLNKQTLSPPKRSETTKPYLQYHFVKKAQEWIIPKRAKTFRDLQHLQQFDADWEKVNLNEIDKSDPDCVYRIVDEQYFMWIPTSWIHTFALTKVPLRGIQIAYNDSGEADEYIADVDEKGKIIWVKNNNIFAGMTKKQSFIMQMHDKNIGMFITTNKTNNTGQGYSIPWMPEELAYWLIKLRKWQEKYNPLTQPSSWIDCIRTNFNELQLKARGVNCFLFRGYKEFEPRNVSNVLAPRLAASLYYIQPKSLTLTTLKGNEATLSHYTSKYTPHSMRVSLITAYVMEMGMPIEVIMKVVGHSSVVMSIYYCKVSNNEIRERLERGEKIALLNQTKATQKMIEQNKIEDVKNNLVASNSDLLIALNNSIPSGNYVFKDYGICPFAASRCEDGGEIIGSTQVYAPTPAGYLGSQNCLRCRHFITGPAYLGGLLSTTNEILLQANIQSDKCNALQFKIQEISNQLNHQEKEEYLANIKNVPFNDTKRKELEIDERKLESDYESAAMKLNILLCDLQAAYGHIKRSQNIINNDSALLDQSKNEYSLIKMQDAEINISLDEVSHFNQLQEVCENATIYQSASAENAILPRSQLLDRMAQFNNLAPRLFLMSKEEQLKVGNELFNLLKSRLKSWERIDQVVNCDLKFEELFDDEKISKAEINLITTSSQYLGA